MGLVSFAAAGDLSRRGVRIVLVGDSTVTDRVGWAGGFRQFLADDVDCVNVARGGRSSKSYRSEGRWTPALALKGDYYLIQFGHNDVPGKGPARETDAATTFAENMTRYVREVRAAGAVPILVTPLAIRTFDEASPARLTGKLAAYAEATRTVAKREGVPLVDLYASSRALCERLGPAEAGKFNPTRRGHSDPTHLNTRGSIATAQLLVTELRDRVPALAPYMHEAPRPLPDAELFTDICYASDGGKELALDISVPTGPGPFPVVVLVNGNTAEDADDAWRLGDAGDIAPWWRALATGSFTRVLVNYRPQHADQDLSAALDWLRAHLADYKGDAERMALCGHGPEALRILQVASSERNPGLLAIAGTDPEWGKSSVLGERRAGDSPAPQPRALLLLSSDSESGSAAAAKATQAEWQARGGSCEVITVSGEGQPLLHWGRGDRGDPARIVTWLREALRHPTTGSSLASP